MKTTIINAIKEHKIIAIARGVSAQTLIPTAEALYEGGIRLMEITYSADGSVCDQDTAACIRALAEHMKGRMYIGAGTVMNREQVELTEQAGGLFIISPNTDVRVIQESCRRGLVSIPGALTPSEIVTAHQAGADFVKLFPAGNFGPGYVKAVKAPVSNVDLLAVGGINEKNIASFLEAGACGAGVGGNLVNSEWIKAGQFDRITQVAAQMVAAVK